MKGIMFPKEIDSCTLMHDNGTSTTDIELIYKKKKEKKQNPPTKSILFISNF
jgi:hypothetical protein